MRCQHVDDDTQCKMEATRRVIVARGDPPELDQSGIVGTIRMVLVCKEHDPDPRRSMPMPRPPGSVPIGERPRRQGGPAEELQPLLDMPYVGAVDVTWRWLVSGVVAISVGLAVWWTAFVLVPVGFVLLVIGMTKSVRSTWCARSR
jgi:hypothetical protein